MKKSGSVKKKKNVKKNITVKKNSNAKKNKKKRIIATCLDIFYILLICFPAHFVFVYFPNVINSVLFPVNESIWEHAKLIPTSTIILMLIYLLLKKGKENNFILANTIASIASIFLMIGIYIPVYLIVGENFLSAIMVMLIAIILSRIIYNYIIDKDEIKDSKVIGLTAIIVMYIIFLIFAYYPPKNMIFYDPMYNLYGIHMSDRSLFK